MIDGFDDMTLAERREALWGLRIGSEPHMNRVRRNGFEAAKPLLSYGPVNSRVLSRRSNVIKWKAQT